MQEIRKIFAENLKNRRINLNMTQKQLAGLLGYSDKAVSKWETGESIAPGEILPMLAKHLGTTVDELLTGTQNQKYYLGIDGGASKTEFALADENGNILERVVLGASNPVDIGMEKCLSVLSDGIRQVCKNVYFSQVSVFAGISGGITGNNQNIIYEFLKKFGFMHTSNGSDAQNAVASCLGFGDGIAVISGTGSIVFSQKDKQLVRTGGHGYLFEDSICGYVLGREAIKAALKHQENSGEQTLITELLKQKLECDNILGKLSSFYDSGKKEVASFAPIVFEAYNKNDNVAKNIIQVSVKELAKQIKTAMNNFESDCPIVLTGSVAANQKYIILNILKDENINATISDKPQICGALLLSGFKKEI